MLKNLAKSLAGIFLGKKAFQGFFEKLFFLGARGMNIGGGVMVSESGEEWVLKYLAAKFWGGKKEVVVFDVGANKGDYALLVDQMLTSKNIKVNIHAFEPSAVTYGLLAASIKNHSNIKGYNFGLGSSETLAVLYSDTEGSGMASVYKRDMSTFNIDFSRQENIKLTALDKFCQGANIETIDFLKLDVEGNELEVLKGAKDFLADNRISTIQFEFGGANIDSRIYLRDFVNLLSGNFALYRILKDGLSPLNYTEWSEVFVTTNFLAINKNI